MLGAACGGGGFAALTASRMGTATAATTWSFACGVTETSDGNEIIGAGNNGTDNDNDGEFVGRPEVRKGDGDDDDGKPMLPNGLTDTFAVRTTCAIASIGTDESNSAAIMPADRGRMGLL